MLRTLALVVAVAGFGVFAGSLFLDPPIECHLLTLTKKSGGVSAPAGRYCGKPDAELEAMWESLESHRKMLEKKIQLEEEAFGREMMKLSQQHRTRRDEAIVQEPEYLRKLRLEHVNTVVEQNDIRAALRIHSLQVGAIGLAAGVGGVAVFLLTLVIGSAGGSSVPKKFRQAVQITETERWMDPIAAENALAALDAKKSRALERLWGLRPNKCSYCEAKLPYEPSGRIDEVTIIKQAPDDVANPKRIVLGRGFQVVPPAEVPCPSCGHKNRL